MTNLIYLGNFADVDPYEDDYQAEHSHALTGVSADSDTLQIVAVDIYDHEHDGVVSDNEYTCDYIGYNTGGGTVHNYTDSTLLGTVAVTLKDGTVKHVEVVLIQQDNGDLFVTELLNDGSLDGLEISSIEITAITGDNYSGWYSNQSVDGASICPPDEKDGTVEGTGGDDLIDLNYDQDPEGDKIDNNDAIVAGEGPQDDIVVAGAGNDTVVAGEGDDDVRAGTGDDKVYGGEGDDVLRGGSGNDMVFGGADSDEIKGGDGDDMLIGGGPSFDGKLDFNDLSAGDVVGGQYAGNGVTISSGTDGKPVMIFDTANPTGGDHDLATGNLGNVLIISEDGDSSDPDDNAGGGTFIFDFDAPASVESLGFLDIEHGAWIKLYDADGNLIGQIDTAATADNGQLTQHIGVDGVSRMEVIIAGSGAIDNLCYKLDGTEGDAADQIFGGAGEDYIEGQLGDDYIDGGADNDEIYGGEGNDRIFGNDGDDLAFGGAGDDNMGGADRGNDEYYGGAGNDMMETSYGDDTLYGGTGNDNLWASADNDLVFGGKGDDSAYGGHGQDTVSGEMGDDTLSGGSDSDTIFGGSGNDIIDGDKLYKDDNGAAGDDTIYGGGGDDKIDGGGGNDTLIGDGGPAEEIDFTIDWDVLGSDGSATFTECEKDVTVSINTPQNAQGKEWFVENGMLKNWDVTDPTTADLHFDQEVTNVQFTLLDVDALDKITIMAKDADGNLVEVQFEDTGVHAVDGNMVTGTQTNNPGPGEDNPGQDVGVTIAGPIQHLWIVLDDGPARDYSGTVAVTDITFTLPMVQEDGDDMIDGGDGDDYIEGNGGDDMLTGGAGNDQIFGGDDADTIFGGAGDTVDGGAGGNDYDVLDLTGQGPFYVTGPGGVGDPIPDSNGNGIDGQIVFVDADGNPTGEVLDFVEIEEIIGDEVNRGPDAEADGFDAGEDDPAGVIGNVLDNDSDPDGDPLQVFKVGGDEANLGQPTAGDNGGLITIDADGTVTFDPNGDFEALGEGETAETTITYMVSDGNGGMDTETVTITVTGVNDGPNAEDSSYIVDQDEAAGDVDGNAITDDTGAGADSDPENDPLNVVAVNGAAGNVGNVVAGSNGGLFTINADGTIDFDANGEFDGLGAGETAQTSVTYTITDPDGETDTATVNFTINGTNDDPIACPDLYIVTEDETNGDVDGNVITNPSDNNAGLDIDPDGDTLTVVGVNTPNGNVGDPVVGDNGGVFVINPDGSFDFSANGEFESLAPGESAETSVTYTVADGNGGTATTTLTIQINGVNDGPTAVDDDLDAGEDDPAGVIGNVLGNDTDPEGDTLEVFKVGGDEANLGQPTAGDSGGLITIAADGTVTFDPNGDFDALGEGETTETTITYMVQDPSGEMSTATVTITVTGTNDDPVAEMDALDAGEDDPAGVIGNVLDNDSDPDGDPLQVFKVGGDEGNLGQPTAGDNGGLITIDADGTVTFDPNGDFDALGEGETAETTITYMVSDGNGGMDTATVTVTVTGTNDAPVAVMDEYTADEDVPSDLGNVLGNDSDPENDPLTVSEVNGDPAGVGTPVAGDNGGLVTINPDGSVSFDPNGEFDGLADGEEATTTVTYTIDDGNGGTDTAEVVITVTGTNDAPVAVMDEYTADEDAPSDLGNVLGNDSDPENDPLTVSEVNGDPAGVGTPVAGDNGGLVTINPDGSVSFDPNGEFDGLAEGEEATTTVVYTIDDGNGGTDTAEVIITVTGTNDAPTAIRNDYVANFDEAAGDVDGNVLTDNTGDGVDSDPEGDTLTVVGVGAPDSGVGVPVAGDNGGLFTINADGTVDFDANGEFDDLGLNDTRTTSVEYTISDGNGGFDTAVATFTVGGINDGTVQGTDGDDIINPDIPYVDADGDVVDNNDAILDGDTGNDDLILGFGGNDSIDAGDGDDRVFGGDGNDTIDGGVGNDGLVGDDGDDTISGNDGDDMIFGNAGNDELFGGEGNDKLEGGIGDDLLEGGDGDDDLWAGAGNDRVVGGEGDDVANGGSGNDVILGNAGNDTLDGASGDDTIRGGTGDDSIDGSFGNDSIVGGEGSDVVDGGNGNDIINTGNHADPAFDNPYPGLGDPDQFPDNDKDTVFGGLGDDVITTGDDADSIDGGGGRDVIDAGIDNDIVDAGTGNDTVIGGEGVDIIEGGDGDDVLYGGLDNDTFDIVDTDPDGNPVDLLPGNNIDTVFGGAGNDTIFGRDDADVLFGGTGNDVIDGGIDNDTITGGEGEDQLFGGQGADTFLGGNGGDVVVGGEDAPSGTFPDGADIDVLDLTGSNVERIEYVPGDPEAGTVFFMDGTTMTFSEIENVIPCFTPGTTIATPRGERLVEELQVGDKVITRDNGIQEIAWVGHKAMNGKQLAANPHLKPILIKAGSLGGGLPERDMLVSPNHRVLVASEKTQLYFEEREVLAAAKHMTGAEGIHAVNVMQTTYVHFMFERHEVVLSNGAWTESFQPGDYSLKGIGNSQRNEIFELFPELATTTGLEGYQAARKALKKHEARLLMK